MRVSGKVAAEIGIPALTTIFGAGLLFLWVSIWLTPSGVTARSLDLGKPAAAKATKPALKVAKSGASAPTTKPTLGSGSAAAPSASPKTVAAPTLAPPALPGEWPGFRGAAHDNVAASGVRIPASMQNLAVAWKIPVGEGYAGAAVKNGRVYLLDFDASAKEDVLRCLSLADGKELWRNSYPDDIKRNHGVTRTIPVTDGHVVVSVGPKGMVLCADALTGQTKWSLDLVAAFGAEVPEWYMGQCPVLDGGRLIIAPVGEVFMTALDLQTGKALWKTPRVDDWTMTHSTIAPMDLGGKRTYVYCGSGGVAGVSASDGKLLWKTTEWKVNTATVPTPVPVGGNRIFLSGGYNAGSLMLQVNGSGGSWTTKQLFRLGAEVFGSDLQTPILYKGHLYGVAPNGELVCLDLNGKRLWGSSTAARFGWGAYLIADGKILILTDNGVLTLADATPAGFHSYGKVQALQGRECWGPMALAGDRLLIRDSENLACIRLGGSS